MATTKITLNQGNFSYEDNATKITGNLNVNEKVINNINGQVMSGELSLGSFDAYRNGENLSFNLHPISIDVAGDLAVAVKAGVEAVQEKL